MAGRMAVSIVLRFCAIVKTSLYIIIHLYCIRKSAYFQYVFEKKRLCHDNPYLSSETVRPAAWTFRGQKSLILSRFLSLNFEGQGVCTLPLVFALESVTGSFLQLYHHLVYKVCISALRQHLIAASKQCVEKIPPFLCCEVKAILSLFIRRSPRR